MALYYFNINHHTKTTASPRSLISYLTRSAEFASPSPSQEVDYLTRSSPQTSERDDLRHVETQNLPPWSHNDPTLFFNASQRYERSNGRWATALQAAFPRELSHEQHLVLARDFISYVLKDKVALWVKHEPTTHTSDGLSQPHIHVLFSERSLDEHSRSHEQFFKQYNPTHPETGGAQKDRFFSQRRSVDRLREAWADLSNSHLQRAGSEARIDPRSLKERGFDREPRPKTYPHRSEPTSPLREKDKEHLLAVHRWQERLQGYDLSQPFAPQVATRMREGSPGKYLDAEVLRYQTQAQLTALTSYKMELEQEQKTLTHRLYPESPLRPTESHRVQRLLMKGRTLGFHGEREVIDRGAQLPSTRNRQKEIGYEI